MIETAREEGIEKGMEKGMEKGRYYEKIDMILTLHEDGVNISSIARASKLSEEEILKILDERKK